MEKELDELQKELHEIRSKYNASLDENKRLQESNDQLREATEGYTDQLESDANTIGQLRTALQKADMECSRLRVNEQTLNLAVGLLHIK